MRVLLMAAAVCLSLNMAGVAAQDAAPAPAAKAPAEEGPPVRFFANLTADEQSAPTESPGWGKAEFTLERATLRLSWKIVYEDMTSAPVAANLHGPQRPGVNTGALINLAPKGLKSPLEGSVILTEAQLQYLMERHMYVNITSAKYKDGELRGQVERFNPARTYPPFPPKS